ncbi:MAG: AsmA family protein [Gammaproteobacteria bacterium]
MRALKIVGIIGAALVGLLIFGIVAILLLVDPNDYRDDIARLAESKTGRPLQIRGKLGLKVFPRLALDIHDVTLGNPAGFGAEPFLTVAQASVGVKLFPLLHKQVEVSRVAVDGLSVTLISRGDEDNNWKDLGESKGEPPTPAGERSAQLTIAGVDVTQSQLLYRDEAKKSTSRLTALEVHTGAVGGTEPIKASIAFDYDEGAAPLVAHLEVKATAQMLDDGKRLELKDLDASGKWFGSPDKADQYDGKAGSKATAAPAKAAEPVAFSIRSPLLALDLDAESLALAKLDVKLGDLPVQLTAKGEKLFGDYVIDGNIAIEKTSARKLMQSFGIEPPVTRDSNALAAFAFKSDYQLTAKQVRLPALDLSLDETQVHGSAAVADLDTMALRFDLDVNAINLDRYMAPETKQPPVPAAASAAAAEKPPTPLPLDSIKGLDVKGQLRVGRATVTGMQFSDIRLPIEVKDDRAHLGPTQAKLFGGSYNGDIVLDARPARAVLSLNEHVRAIDIGALMKAGLDTTRIAGRGNANAQLTATGNTDAAMFKSLAGKIEFDVKDGAFTGVDLWYEIRRAMALYKGQGAPARDAGPAKTAFTTLAGTAAVDKGVLRNDDLAVDMNYLKVKGKGTLALTTQAIDYRLVTEVYKLPDEPSASGLAELKAAELPITITGTLADMKVRPDVEGYLKARFKKKVDEKVDAKKEELKRKLGDKLKGLLGH